MGAKDIHKHCKDTLEHEMRVNVKESSASIRQFVFIDKEEENRSQVPSAKTLVGTRKIHNIRNTGKRMVLESRNLSCFCTGCITGAGGCQNSEYVQQWIKTDLTCILNTETAVILLYV